MTKKIIAVDDDTSILEAIATALEMEGYIVYTIDNSASLIPALHSFKPDLILLDVLLSGADGRDIAYTLKHDPDLHKIPIIMLSASPQAGKSSRDFGADAFLSKPFDLDSLYKVVSSVLKEEQS